MIFYHVHKYTMYIYITLQCACMIMGAFGKFILFLGEGQGRYMWIKLANMKFLIGLRLNKEVQDGMDGQLNGELHVDETWKHAYQGQNLDISFTYMYMCTCIYICTCVCIQENFALFTLLCIFLYIVGCWYIYPPDWYLWHLWLQ